jgi:CubicO group peptidase (beta-lactamase class C family)
MDMKDTSFFVPGQKVNRLSAMYHVAETGSLTLLDAPSTSPYLNPDSTASGGGGLVSTSRDYLRFAQMLLNGGELGGVRLLSRKTVELMTMNHLPDELLTIHSGSDLGPGMGYGLGFGVCVDVAQSGSLGSRGRYGWGGAAGTDFWVDPKEGLIGLLMEQLFFGEQPIGGLFRNLVYQAIVD